MLRILYRFLTALASLAVRSGRSKDLEIIVLRHQLMVLRGQHSRPPLNDNDRTLLGALAAALPRSRRTGWLVTPERWIGTVRRELLDRTIIWSRSQLERHVIDYINHYTTHRPHRSLDQRPPLETEEPRRADQSHLRVVKLTRCKRPHQRVPTLPPDQPRPNSGHPHAAINSRVRDRQHQLHR